MLDVTQRLVLIVGGGAVAVRKVKGLLDAGATRVRVVSPTFHAEMPAGIDRIAAAYDACCLNGADIVFAATDSTDINERVALDATARGVWVNRADEGEEGDFVTPAKWRDGSIVITASAGSAALSAAIRDDLAKKLDRRHVMLAHAMQTLRPAVRSSEPDAQRRAAIFRDLSSDEALDAIGIGGIEGLQRFIQTRYPQLKV